METQFTDEKPIYVQLMDRFKAQIASGALAPGGRLPSVRELAVGARVNPNTMQKALSELEREGLLYTERTSGRFITQDCARIAVLRETLAQKEVGSFIQRMRSLGFEKDDLVALLGSAEQAEL